MRHLTPSKEQETFLAQESTSSSGICYVCLLRYVESRRGLTSISDTHYIENLCFLKCGVRIHPYEEDKVCEEIVEIVYNLGNNIQRT
jgi:hypothetical protein